MLGVIVEAIKKFAGEIIGAAVLVLVWLIYRARNFVRAHKKLKQENERLNAEVIRLKVALREAESNSSHANDIRRLENGIRNVEARMNDEIQQRAELQRNFESQQEEIACLKAEILSRDEALKQAVRITELQTQLESKAHELERLQTEIQRKDEVLREVKSYFHRTAEQGDLFAAARVREIQQLIGGK